MNRHNFSLKTTENGADSQMDPACEPDPHPWLVGVRSQIGSVEIFILPSVVPSHNMEAVFLNVGREENPHLARDDADAWRMC